MTSKFEVFTIVSYWIGFCLWIYAAHKARQSKKKLDDAFQLLVDTQQEIRERFRDDTQV